MDDPAAGTSIDKVTNIHRSINNFAKITLREIAASLLDNPDYSQYGRIIHATVHRLATSFMLIGMSAGYDSKRAIKQCNLLIAECGIRTSNPKAESLEIAIAEIYKAVQEALVPLKAAIEDYAKKSPANAKKVDRTECAPKR